MMFEMDKCREEFEKWLDERNMFMNIERRFDQKTKSYKYCAIQWIWESWQHQQLKINLLEDQLKMVTNSYYDLRTERNGYKYFYSSGLSSIDWHMDHIDKMIKIENEEHKEMYIAGYKKALSTVKYHMTEKRFLKSLEEYADEN